MKKIAIYKSLAGFMLVLFAFSITPKLILHDLFARHKDLAAVSSSDDLARISLSGFRCNCENLVVESPFVAEITNFEIEPRRDLSSPPAGAVSEFHNATHFFPEFRGPPSIC